MPYDNRLSGQNPAMLPGLARWEDGVSRAWNLPDRCTPDQTWPHKNRLAGLARTLAIVVTVVILALVCSACQQPTPDPCVSKFGTNPDADMRIKCLAGLLKLPGQEPTAQKLFDSLNQPEKVALFKSSDPQVAGKELVTVVKAFYVDLPNDVPGNELLVAMDSPLARLLEDTIARSLSVEIEHWQQGRTRYRNAQDIAAVEAYNSAIELNPRNPGTRLDRALAYARLGQQTGALNDLTEILRLNSNSAWKDRVQQVLLGNQGLYDTLWNQKDKYPALVALMLAPTYTPIPTMPAPTQTPIPPTSTYTPAPPTPTYTPTPKATLLPPVVLRAVSPLYPTMCRNPVTFRWTGPLQLYQIYRVIVRNNSLEIGTVNLPGSPRLTDPVWQAQLPDTVNIGGVNHAVFGEIEWQVLINDGRTGKTVNRSDWFKFYFSEIDGQSCP